MAAKNPGRKKAGSVPIEKSLIALGQKLSRSTERRRGSIHVTLTDTGDEFSLEGVGGEVQVSRGTGASPPVVRVAGPAGVLQAIMDGKKEASRAFIAGGIQVSGDLEYLEDSLKTLGLLECE
jgi:predicted lipid carrier protein YhbT